MENGQDTKERAKEDKDELVTERQAKRPKTAWQPSTKLSDCVLPTVLDSVQQLRAAYQAAQPYPHAAISAVFQSDFLRQAIDEIQHDAKVNFKESDLFRVYQSMDLANLTQTEHATKMPAVWQLRQILYSHQWRSFIEEVCGLEEGTLIDKVDCACNCHIEGCHLLCHDDVIGTRKVSYIIYLTEDDWTLQEGGALELYDRVTVPKDDGNEDDQVVPGTIPTKTHLPMRNSMAFFVVQPGVSFHAVQEVLGSRPRLSLQGWYHAAEPPAEISKATLQRLKDKDSTDVVQEQTFCPYPSTTPEAAQATDITLLSDNDKAYLANYVQATYLQPDSMAEIKKRFEDESSVQLRQFLKDEWMERITKEMTAQDAKDTKPVTDPDYYRQGIGNGWTLTGPSHKQRFLEYHCNEAPQIADTATSMGEMMAVLKKGLLESQPFRRYLALLTSLGQPLGFCGRLRRFRRGLDYTVAHHGLLMEQSVLDATLCFVAGKGKDVQTDMEKQQEEQIHQADVDWQSGDYGGFECYIEADDDEEGEGTQGGAAAGPADEYNEDDDTELLSVSASNNTLNLVYRDQGTMRFVKYVGSKAPSSRYDIAMVYEVEQDENEGDEEEEQEPKNEEKS